MSIFTHAHQNLVSYFGNHLKTFNNNFSQSTVVAKLEQNFIFENQSLIQVLIKWYVLFSDESLSNLYMISCDIIVLMVFV